MLRRVLRVGAPAALAIAAAQQAQARLEGTAPSPLSAPLAAASSAHGVNKLEDIAPDRKLRVGILGATGAVGQRFVHHLQGHPWFEIVALGASRRSSGKPYRVSAHWTLEGMIPDGVDGLVVRPCEADSFADVDFVFSALDASVAGEIEADFVSHGIPVFSNARNFRMHPNVPLIVPPVNPDHLEMVKSQRSYSDTGAFIVTNANCSTTGMVIALEPIQRAFGIEAVIATTMQAISGAGYPGLSALDMLDNVMPRISGEEPKLESEYQKIMGDLVAGSGAVTPASFPLSASTNRVLVRDGHMLCLAIKLKTPATPADVERALAEFVPRDPLLLRMPSAPAAFVHVAPGGADADRPQPRLDREAGGGFSTVVGRVRSCPVMDIKLTLCSHNTVMGAAGSSILNAELAAARRVLKPRLGVVQAAAGHLSRA